MSKASSLLTRSLGWLLVAAMIMVSLAVFAPATRAELPLYNTYNNYQERVRAMEIAKAQAEAQAATQAEEQTEGRASRSWTAYYPPVQSPADTQPALINPQVPDTQPVVVYPVPPDTMPITVDPLLPDTQPIYVNPVTPVIGDGMTIGSAYLYDSMTKGSRIAKLKKGETFIVYQIAGKRLAVELDDGTYGYVDMSKCNVDLRAEYHLPFVTIRDAKVFGQPKEKRSSLLFTLPEESGVTLTGFRGDWAMIHYGEEVGYTPYKNLAYTG